MDNITNFLDYLYEKTIDTKVKKDKKIYDVLNTEPTERTDTREQEQLFQNIKEEILHYVHKNRLTLLKQLMHDYNIPPETKAEWEKLMVPLSEISEETNKDYAKRVASIYSIFQKYIETKKTVQSKIEKAEEQEVPLATVRMMIQRGDSLGQIADHFGLAKSSLAHKLQSLYQTSYSELKKKAGK